MRTQDFEKAYQAAVTSSVEAFTVVDGDREVVFLTAHGKDMLEYLRNMHAVEVTFERGEKGTTIKAVVTSKVLKNEKED